MLGIDCAASINPHYIQILSKLIKAKKKSPEGDFQHNNNVIALA